MAIFHRATLSPTKQELIATWAPTQSWGPDEAIELIGSFRFDDPEGRVGMETHLCSAGGELFQIPLTYRDEPLEGGEQALITEMDHSVLGNRWVYDGLRDPRLVMLLAGVAMTGQGEALGMNMTEGRWYIVPAVVRIRAGGWTQGPVPIDGFELVRDDANASVLQSDRFELTVFRRPQPGPQPKIGLTATWTGQDEPIVLATVTEQ